MQNVIMGAATPNAGRLTTFTFPDTNAERLYAAMAALGYSRVCPDMPSPAVALSNACRVFESRFAGRHDVRFSRRFARKLSHGKAEIVREELDQDSGATRRDVVATVTVNGIESRDQDVADLWVGTFDFYTHHIAASAMGQWGEIFACERWNALPLANRGHSLHIVARHAGAFDRWLAAMGTVCDVQATTFATIDNDPASMLAIVASLRAQVEGSVKRELEKACNASTPAGRAAAGERLTSLAGMLDNYRGLAEGEVSELSRAVVEARAACVMGTL